MESATPFVGVISPYGAPYFLGLAYKSVRDNETPFVLVESENAAASFAQTFRLKYPDIKVSIDPSSTPEAQIFFVSHIFFLDYLLEKFKKHIPEKVDFTKHIYYMLPNNIPYHMTSYVIMRVLEEVFFQGTKIPSVTLLGVNTQNFPVIKSSFTIFNKHSEEVAINYQLFGKNLMVDTLYDEMSKLILRIHMETPGRNILAILPTKNEIETLIGILQKVEVARFHIHNIYDGGEWKLDPIINNLTTLYVATNEVESLVMVPIDIVIDSFRIVQPGKTMSGEETSVATTSTKDISLGRCSILQNKIRSRSFSDKAGSCYIMTDKINFELEKVIAQSITQYLLQLGRTEIPQIDIFPDHPLVHSELISLQSYGALNPDYRTTAIGEFLIDVPLSAGEGVVLWHYLQEYWVREASCLPVLITTSMISLFSEENPYYLYPPIKGDEVSDYYYEQEKHRRDKWSIFSGSDDLETYLNIWFRMAADLNTFVPSYDDLKFWSHSYSLNGDQLSRVLDRIISLKEIVQKYGFVCEKDSIEPKKDISILRKLYSKVYLLKRMKSLDKEETLYQNIANQQVYTIYYPLSINTTSVTVPPEIVAPLTSDLEVFVVVLYRE